MDIKLVLVTCPDTETAEKISREIVRKKLAACSNIISGLKSIYQWEGKLEESSEVLMLIKAQESCLKLLEEEVVSLHPYDTPEFIVLDTSMVNKKYAAWVSEVCKES